MDAAQRPRITVDDWRDGTKLYRLRDADRQAGIRQRQRRDLQFGPDDLAGTDAEVSERINARLERQKLLDGSAPLELWAVVDEAATRRVVGGRAVMAAQLRHALDMMNRPNITVQVIPFDTGAHPGMPGAFVLMEFRDELDPELVYVDTLAGDIFLEADDDVRRYRQMFDYLRAGALSPADSAKLISSVAEGWK